jgi:hypothetical protein
VVIKGIPINSVVNIEGVSKDAVELCNFLLCLLRLEASFFEPILRARLLGFPL